MNPHVAHPRTRCALLAWIAAAWLALAVATAAAQPASVPEGQSASAAAHADPAHAHASHPHHVSVLLGGAYNGAIEENGFTIGAGYRYAINDRFAVGPMLDLAFYDAENTTLLAAAVFWKPVGGLLLVAGPGVEFVSHKASGHDAHSARSGAAEEGTTSKFAFRLGAAYEFHAGKLSITPGIGTDFVDGHATFVYIVSFGFGF